MGHHPHALNSKSKSERSHRSQFGNPDRALIYFQSQVKFLRRPRSSSVWVFERWNLEAHLQGAQFKVSVQTRYPSQVHRLRRQTSCCKNHKRSHSNFSGQRRVQKDCRKWRKSTLQCSQSNQCLRSWNWILPRYELYSWHDSEDDSRPGGRFLVPSLCNVCQRLALDLLRWFSKDLHSH